MTKNPPTMENVPGPERDPQGRTGRVLIVEKGGGVLSWGADLAEGFREIGVESRLTRFRAFRTAERFSQWRGRGRGWHNLETVARIAGETARFRPQLVVLLNLPGLPQKAADALRRALEPPPRIVGWLCDRPHRMPEGFEPVLDAVFYFDSACLTLLDTVYRGTSSRRLPLPLAASGRRYACPKFPRGSRKPLLAFAGYASPSRKKTFADYRALGGNLAVYGPGSAPAWNLWRNRRLGAAELAGIYRSHLLNLNLTQPENTERGLNLRAFEIACAGGLGCYPAVPDLAAAFRPGEEIVSFTSLEELREKAEHLFRHPEEALAMAEAGWRRARAEHLFRHRAETLLRETFEPTGRPADSPTP